MGQTPNFRFTTPENTDLVRDGAQAIRTVAGEIDTAMATKVLPVTAPANGVVASGKFTFNKVQMDTNGITLWGPRSAAQPPYLQAYYDERIKMQTSVAGLPGAYAYVLVQHVGATKPAALTTDEHAHTAVSWFSMASYAQPRTASSAAVKTDVTPVDVSLFDGVEPVAFTYKQAVAGAAAGDRRLGFIAEQVADAGIPVAGDGDGAALHPVDLVAVLWAKVQQLESRIEVLEAGR